MDPNIFRYIWQHSRHDQLKILALIVLSLPFYFASFDIPKRIINEALQGKAFLNGVSTARFFRFSIPMPEFLGGHTVVLSDGFDLSRTQLLMALSFIFLTLVLINGAFKYIINMSKGVLGERMLRRIRFELFALLLRFRPEDIRTIKPAEAATIIKDEVEPIGGFAGDAFIQPAFLGMQAATATLFIIVQSHWLGLVALSVVLIQAYVIPRLRREQLRLARERQIESRKLAGRIGEVIEGASAIHVHGVGPFTEAEIGGRLGVLYKIRADLFRRKFAVKYLNNLLAQVTPFFFYTIGGYLALTGTLDIGQLVAVIAAYRDLPPPIKELIDWDQERADVTIKYQQIVSQFPMERLRQAGKAMRAPADTGPIAVESIRFVDQRGTPRLETMSATIVRPAHVSLVGAAGSGRDILAQVLGRQMSDFSGRVHIDGISLAEMPDGPASRFMAYAGPDPLLFSGTVRDNIALALCRSEPVLDGDGATENLVELQRRDEAERSGNPIKLASDAWLDLSSANLQDKAELDAEIMRVLGITGFGEEVYRLGLLGRIDAAQEPDMARRLLAARQVVRQNLAAESISKLIAPFDPQSYNPNATVAENLLFGLPIGDTLSDRNLASDPYARSILEAEALLIPLANIGLRMAETAIEVFADLPPGHSLFERYSFFQQEEMPEFKRLVDTAASRRSVTLLPSAGQARLVQLALSYVEPRHRMNLLEAVLEQRICRARRSFRTYLPATYAQRVEFYDPDIYTGVAPIRDNLLFGRVTFGVAGAEKKVMQVLRKTLRDLDLERIVNRVGLDYNVGPSGRLLFNTQRASVALARCLIARPSLLIMDNALTAFGPVEARQVLANVREAMSGKTLLVTRDDTSDARDFDRVLEFEGPRYIVSRDAGHEPDPPAVRAPDQLGANRQAHAGTG